ncbi:MFS transporter [Actinoplanes sp. NPDC051346]|uniref:MFS transporter n=1 Tax=Actinoplanes sp. NPDC051346 TaxID=3155048 RepID=UPI0034366A89
MSSLWRNREFNLLWAGQTLSELGDTVALLALPLLVLTFTGSPVQAGLVGTIALVTRLLCRLPIGVLVDQVDRRRAMIVCDVVRLAAFVGLGVAVVAGWMNLAVIIVVAIVDAACGSLFGTAEHAALRSIVPTTQLPEAVARNEARSYGASLVGPPLGGLLFGLGHALPFFGNAVSYLGSLVGVALIRKPLQSDRQETPARYGVELAEGVKFVFRDPFRRALLAISAPLNLAFNGAIFAIILTLQRHGTPPAVIGLTETIIGVGGLLGAFAAPALQRWLRLTVLVRTICWAATGLIALSALFTASVAAAVPVAVALFLSPACNAALFSYQSAITPDRLQGRVVSVIFLVANSAAAAAPMLAGVFVATWGGPAAILCFAAAASISAIAATVGRGIREMRPLTEAEAEAEAEAAPAPVA